MRAYYQFCDRFHLQYFPASTTQITRFAVYLFGVQGLTPETITNYVSAVRTIHGILELEVPNMSNVVFQAVIKGMKARLKRAPRQAQPIDPFIFKQIAKHVNFEDPLELVAWVACLMGFHLLLRASNLTSRSSQFFDPEQNLVRADFRRHQTLLVAHIRWTKTLQYKERKLLIPVIPFTDDDISAVAWFHYMIHRIPAPPHAPAFSVPKGGKLYPLSYSQLSRLLKKWTSLAGLNSSALTAHCLRRGGASWLKEKGVSDSVIAAMGDWRTFTFLKYIDSALRTRLDAMIEFASRQIIFKLYVFRWPGGGWSFDRDQWCWKAVDHSQQYQIGGAEDIFRWFLLGPG